MSHKPNLPKSPVKSDLLSHKLSNLISSLPHLGSVSHPTHSVTSRRTIVPSVLSRLHALPFPSSGKTDTLPVDNYTLGALYDSNADIVEARADTMATILTTQSALVWR